MLDGVVVRVSAENATIIGTLVDTTGGRFMMIPYASGKGFFGERKGF